ncbi:LysR family transcriptional regulator [Streptacidiphilus sp. EB103A]|uniref:helix-turn-helix domain-containing protein n=1 Tax=Streptacidiphilus sp. EB103A TaxID=3156275 RepID=UPI003518A6F6
MAGAEQFPPLLRPAVGTRSGRRQLLRFLEAARFPSLKAFARETGLDPTTVARQIRRLERTLDGQLLIHGGHGHPARPTRLGKRVLAVTAQWADRLSDLHRPQHRSKIEASVAENAPPSFGHKE